MKASSIWHLVETERNISSVPTYLWHQVAPVSPTLFSINLTPSSTISAKSVVFIFLNCVLLNSCHANLGRRTANFKGLWNVKFKSAIKLKVKCNRKCKNATLYDLQNGYQNFLNFRFLISQNQKFRIFKNKCPQN